MFVFSQKFQSLLILLILIVFNGGGRQSAEGNQIKYDLLIIVFHILIQKAF